MARSIIWVLQNCHKFSCMQNVSWSTVIFTLKIKSEVQVNQQTHCYTIQWEQLPVIWNQTLLINSISKRLNNFTHITLNSCVICKTTADVILIRFVDGELVTNSTLTLLGDLINDLSNMALG